MTIGGRSAPTPSSADTAARRPSSPLPVIDALARVPLFVGLPHEALEALGRQVRTRRTARGETIFHQGDPGDALYIVASGRVKIVLHGDLRDAAIVATLRRGDFFGELALLDGAERSATAISIDAAELLVLPRERFLELVAEFPPIRDALLMALAHELRRITDHVAELHFLDITGRLAARLARLVDEQGMLADDGSLRLDGPLTQGDLAAMVGCTRQSVNKVLGEFASDGLIRLERDTIVVRDLPGLRQAARR